MKRKQKPVVNKPVYAVDLFCGAGGLTIGLQQAGVEVLAGIDSDPACAHAYQHNSKATFIESDIRAVKGDALKRLYPKGAIRLLAGCAPCKPFSSLRSKRTRSESEEWVLLKEFSRIARELQPELLTMENVPRLGSKAAFREFVKNLEELGYETDWESVYCPRFGIPQMRRRLVLVASKIGPVDVPKGVLQPHQYPTVREAISKLPSLKAGSVDPNDSLHRARTLTPLNMARMRASKPNGSWLDWPSHLRAPCHNKKSGASYKSVYARMEWDAPSPTITTQAFNFGTGRFGHPEQDRAISLREAAILQSFPSDFVFLKEGNKVTLATVGRLIGNAVPPRLAYHIGREMMRVVQQSTKEPAWKARTT